MNRRPFLRVLISYSLILITLSGCSLFSQSKTNVLDGQGVAIDKSDGSKKLPRIQRTSSPDYLGVGPEPKGKQETLSIIKKSKTPVVGLVLGPGLNRVAAHIALLRAFDRHRIPIRLISGSGMGAIVAALYANGMTSEMIEWNFYKFFNTSKGLKPYGDKWTKVVKKTLLKHLEKKKIQNSSISLVVPVYSRKKRVVHYLKRGSLFVGLLTNLQVYRGGNTGLLSAPFEWEVYNREQLKKLGADILIGIDVLGEDVDLVSGDDFLIGVFGRVASLSKRQKDKMDLFFEMPVNSMPLDSQDDLPGLLQRCLTAGNLAAIQVKEKITNWSEGIPEKKIDMFQDWKEPENQDQEESETSGQIE